MTQDDQNNILPRSWKHHAKTNLQFDFSRRRTLKNRGYAASCRIKRLEQKGDLEHEKGKEYENLDQVQVQALRENSHHHPLPRMSVINGLVLVSGGHPTDGGRGSGPSPQIRRLEAVRQPKEDPSARGIRAVLTSQSALVASVLAPSITYDLIFSFSLSLSCPLEVCLFSLRVATAHAPPGCCQTRFPAVSPLNETLDDSYNDELSYLLNSSAWVHACVCLFSFIHSLEGNYYNYSLLCCDLEVKRRGKRS